MPRAPDERVTRYLQFYSWRIQEVPEDKIAADLSFDSSSDLYQRLNSDGFPVCSLCGATPAGPGHCEPPTTKRKRKARQGGEAVELPPAHDARSLFREAAQALSKIVDPPPPPSNINSTTTMRQFVDSQDRLGELEEFLQGERFVSAYIYRPDPEEVVFRREDFTEEGWVAACEAHGEDPAADVFVTDGTGVYPQGAKQTPAGILVKLIGAYVLAGRPLEPLVAKLHPDPSNIDWDQLNMLIHGKERAKGSPIEGMMDKVHKVARLVRGGPVRTGPNTGELSREELQTAWEIARWKYEGYSNSQIHEFLEHRGYTRAEVDRLGNLRPNKPDTNLEAPE